MSWFFHVSRYFVNRTFDAGALVLVEFVLFMSLCLRLVSFFLQI